MNKSKWWLLVLAVILVGCQGGGINSIPATQTPVTPVDNSIVESYAVYDAVMQEMAGGNLARIVITGETSTGHGGLDGQSAPEAADPAAWDDYRDQNKESHTLNAGLFNVGVPVVLISNEEVNAIFSQESEDGWELFYKKYPDSQGLMTLSAVGFNFAYTSAVVYMGNQSHWLAGAGYMIVLEKRDGKWVIIDQQMIWIS